MNFVTLNIYIISLLVVGCFIYYLRLINFVSDDYISTVREKVAPVREILVQNTAKAIVNTVPANVLSPVLTDISKIAPIQTGQTCNTKPKYVFPEETNKFDLPWDNDIQKCSDLEPNMFYPKSFMI